MNLNEYQKQAKGYDLLERNGELMSAGFLAKILGLSGETGELMEKFKKIIRDKGGKISEEDKLEIVKELGDVLWYTAVLAEYLGVEFEEVGRMNLAKLESRRERGVMQGSGDNR